jgi:hypothetical protein
MVLQWVEVVLQWVEVVLQWVEVPFDLNQEVSIFETLYTIKNIILAGICPNYPRRTKQ